MWNTVICPNRLSARNRVTGSSAGRPVMRPISSALTSLSGLRMRVIRISLALAGSWPPCSRAKNIRWFIVFGAVNIRSDSARSSPMNASISSSTLAWASSIARAWPTAGANTAQPCSAIVSTHARYTPSLFSK